ncbi:MAG: hypothetical protein DRI56_09680 [Chloroflexota bacterium]|nr:MAG: hypothetical protein DRI56_09680 [Chloroflexota bacterium]
MNAKAVLPTVSNIRDILKLAGTGEEETLAIKLSRFLTRQQTIITHTNNNTPFRTTPSGKYIISDSIVRDMADVGSFTDTDLSKLFQDIFASLEVEYFDLFGFDDPIPYSIQ